MYQGVCSVLIPAEPPLERCLHMRKARTHALTLGAAFLAVVLPIVFVFAAPASANTLSNSNVTQSTTGTVTSGTPYSSGQTIQVSVGANSTLAGDSSVEVWECSDYDGTTTNLPSSAENNCDGNTTIKVTAINSDGSIPAFAYTVYALPDSVTFGESSDSLPVCGVYPDDCVLYIGASTGFSAGTYIFGPPFQVSQNGTDSGADPGDGTPEVPLAIGLPLLAVAIGGGSLYLRRRRRAHAS